MSALGLVQVLSHWEHRRLVAQHTARRHTAQGLPALAQLRQASRCQARLDKLVRLLERAATPRGAA